MLKNETAIILGAGASQTFKLPLGSDLRADISKALNIRTNTFESSLQSGSPDIMEAIRIHARQKEEKSINIYISAAHEISAALPLCSSIDDVIERHAGKDAHSLCAKLAIAESILKYERKSGLRHDPNKNSPPDIAHFDSKWITTLLQTITKGCGESKLQDAFSRVKVINFNYDRCFEGFSFLWLKKVYGISDEYAANCIRAAKIIHPYGSIGKLPFDASNKPIGIGYQADPRELLDICSNIYTYSESRASNTESEEINDIMDGSRNIIFLGFAFHSQNMNLLTTGSKGQFTTRHVYTTDVNMPEPRWDVIRDRLSACLDVASSNLYIHRSPESCERLMWDFGENLAEY